MMGACKAEQIGKALLISPLTGSYGFIQRFTVFIILEVSDPGVQFSDNRFQDRLRSPKLLPVISEKGFKLWFLKV